jgi:hypothetical protein
MNASPSVFWAPVEHAVLRLRRDTGVEAGTAGPSLRPMSSASSSVLRFAFAVLLLIEHAHRLRVLLDLEALLVGQVAILVALLVIERLDRLRMIEARLVDPP